MGKVVLTLIIVLIILGQCDPPVLCKESPKYPEPVKAIQRYIGGTSIRLLPELRYSVGTEEVPIGPADDPPNMTTLSPDGKRLFFIREMETIGVESFLAELMTGKVIVAKMPGQKVVKYGGVFPLPFIRTGIWDPLSPEYLYALIPEGIDENKRSVINSVWRINSVTMEGKRIINSTSDMLRNITPDGKSLLFIREIDDIYNPFLYALSTNS